MTPSTTVPTTTPTRTERATNGLLVTIVLAVGLMAGAASFNHVHDWTMHNSPAHTADWFGWANAVITELIPTAALIIIARRRRTGVPIGYPMFLLVVAVGLSLTAQLAVAQPSVFGWMVSALPALAFFALSKLVFTTTRVTRSTNPASALTPATVAPAPSTPDTAPATVRPAAEQPTATTPIPDQPTRPQPALVKNTPASASSTTIPTGHTGATGTTRAAPVSTGLTDLLPGARLVVQAHRQAHGEPITPGQLAVRMRISTTTAEQILNHFNQLTRPATVDAHNGSRIGAAQ
jgi:hypothetical protein